jgi:hypothetical protein
MRVSAAANCTEMQSAETKPYAQSYAHSLLLRATYVPATDKREPDSAASPFDLPGRPRSISPIMQHMLPLTLTEGEGLVRLQVDNLARGEGRSLQDAADDLVRRLLGLAIAFRSSGFKTSCELQPDLEAIGLLYELGEIAAAGGDIRARVFG